MKKINVNDYIKKIQYLTGFILNLNNLNRYLLIFSVGILGSLFYNLEYKWNLHTKYNLIKDGKSLFDKQKQLIENINFSNIKIDSYMNFQWYTIFFIFLVLILFYVRIHKKEVILWSVLKKNFSFILGILLITSLTVGKWKELIFLVKLDIFVPLILLFVEFILGKWKELILKKSDNEKIYKNRVVEWENFQRILEEKKSKKLILIDGPWGIGKSFFVKEALKKKTLSNYHKINLDILLFNDKKQIISQTMNEINLILEKEGIRDNSSKKYAKIINYVTSKYSLNLNFLKQEKSLDEIEVNLENDLKKLKNTIIIIVENLERTLERNTVIDTLGFLHKIYSLGDNNMKIVLLADTLKINDLNGMKDYLDKFFDTVITLGNIRFKEILDSVNFSEKSIIKKEQFLLVFEEILDILNNMENNKEYSENFKKIVSSYSGEIRNCLSNSRNILKVIEKSTLLRNNYDNYFIDSRNFNESTYQKIIIIIQVYKYVLGISNQIQFHPSKYSIYRKMKKAEYDDNNDFFYEFIFSIEEFKTNLTVNDAHFMFNSIGRIIEGKSESKEKKIIEEMNNYKYLYEKSNKLFKNNSIRLIYLPFNYKLWNWVKYKFSLRKIWNHNPKFENFLEDYVYFIKYLDKENLKNYIYYEIFNQIGSSINAKEIKISTIIELLKSEEFLLVDKNYEEKNEKSIFDFLDNINDYDGLIQHNLLKTYINEFILFSYMNLNLNENIIYISDSKFLDKFMNDFQSKYIDCDKDIQCILKYIVNNLSDIDIKLKQAFEKLLKKLNRLEIGFSNEEQIEFSFKNDIKRQMFLYKFHKGKQTISGLNHWMEKSKLIDELLMKSLREELYIKLRDSRNFNVTNKNYIKYYNEKINELVEIVPNDFYKSIIVSLGNFYQLNNKLILNIEIIDTLLNNTINFFINSINPLIEKYYEIEDNIEKLNQEKEKNSDKLNKEYFAVSHPINELTRRFLANSNKNYKRDVSENIDLSKQEINKFLEVNEKYEFDNEIDNNSIENIEKSCNEENRTMFKIAVPLAKEQTKIDIKSMLLEKKKSAINDEIMEEITSFFEKINIIDTNLWKLIYSSIDSYFLDKNSKLQTFLIKYESDKNK